jgi:competence protein ComEA
MKYRFLVSLLSVLSLAGIAFTATSQETPKSESEVRIDINAAGVEELVKLPGIGEQVAKRIVAYREENGPFEKAEELMNVRGIGEKSFLKLQSRITVGPDREDREKRKK